MLSGSTLISWIISRADPNIALLGKSLGKGASGTVGTSVWHTLWKRLSMGVFHNTNRKVISAHAN